MGPRGHRRLEEPFILLGMVSLLAGAVWLNVRYPLLLGFYYSNELLAITHTLTLGFVTSLIMGVFHRLAPMALFVEPRSRLWARVQFGFYGVGVIGMVFHFVIAKWSGLAWSALMVWCAAAIQLYNWAGVWTIARRGDWVARYAATSQLYLLLAASLGLFLGSAKALPGLFQIPHGTFITSLYAHVHLAALGWVTNMLFGFQLRLWPRTVGRREWIPLRYLMLQVGVVGMSTTWLFDVGNRIPFAVLVAAAVLWQAWGPARAWLSGRVRDPELLPMVVLFAAALAGLVLALGWPHADEPVRLRLQLAYGFVVLWGGFVLSIAIFAFRLFPMWVWQERFQAEFGKAPVPGMRDLFSRRLRKITHASLLSGVVGTATAITAGWEGLLRVSLAVLLGGVVAFLWNFFRVARWALTDKPFVPDAVVLAEFHRLFPRSKAGPSGDSG